MPSYTPNTWTTGDVVSKTKLDRLEAGTAAALATADAAELIRDTTAATLVAGTNVTIVNNDAADTITISASGGSGSGSGGVPAAARTVYLTDPPSGSGLSAIAANGSTNDRAAVQAALDYVDATWGSGYVIGPIGSTVKCNTGITIPNKVQLRDIILDFTSMTGTATAITVNDTDFMPLYNVKATGPGKTSAVTGVSVTGVGCRFERLELRTFFRNVDLAHTDTYINTFVQCAIGEAGTCVYQDIAAAGASNAGEKTIFRDSTFFNSNKVLQITNNQGGVFFDGCSFDYSAEMGYISTSHVFFTNCHIESTYVATPNGYLFEPAYEARLSFTACNFIMGSTGGEGLRFIIKSNTGPSVNGRGRVLFADCMAYFVDTSHNGQQRFSEELVWIDGGSSSKTFETPFVSNWNPVTARPGAYQGDTQAQATVTVSTGFSSGAQNGQVTVTGTGTVTGGTYLPVSIKF